MGLGAYFRGHDRAVGVNSRAKCGNAVRGCAGLAEEFHSASIGDQKFGLDGFP
jgi:hypothetical protein